MTTKIEFIKGDKLNDLFFQLQDVNGDNLSLASMDVIKLNVQKSNTTGLKFAGVCTIEDEVTGEIKYQTTATDFDEIGIYNAEIELTYLDGQIATFSDIKIIVKSDLPSTI